MNSRRESGEWHHYQHSHHCKFGCQKPAEDNCDESCVVDRSPHYCDESGNGCERPPDCAPQPPAQDGTSIGWKNPRRPGRHCGTSTGTLPGGELSPSDFDPKGPNTWPGQRADLYLPFLFMRANPGDLGARPVVGPFWESPDILILADTEPAVAPRVPPRLGDTAIVGRPNTLYAHVWNFGMAQAPNVVVEFYWCDPSLGIGPAGAHLIGQTMVSLGSRGSGKSHTVVKCPIAWNPTFVNGGHECLLVRVWDETSDGLGTPPWDAALNRHLAQRNIHVIPAPNQPHALAGPLLLADNPIFNSLSLKVGPLYGEPALVKVERTAPQVMPWMQLHTGVRGKFPPQAPATGQILLSAPRTIGSATSPVLGSQHEVIGDDQEVAFSTGDRPPKPGEAHIYRVTASQRGEIFGGYTVVMLG